MQKIVKTITPLLLLTTACILNTPPSTGNTGTTHPAGHGGATVQTHYAADPGIFGIAEEEPNDWPANTQYIGEALPGQIFHIAGHIAEGETDVFRLNLEEPLSISWRLAPTDITKHFKADIGLIDYTAFTCSIDGIGQTVFAECNPDAQQSLRTGTTVSPGTIEIVVAGQSDSSNYTLELAFWSSTDTEFRSEKVESYQGKTISSETADSQSTRFEMDNPGELVVAFEKGMSREEIKSIVNEADLELLQYSPSGLCLVSNPMEQEKYAQNQKAMAASLKIAGQLPGVRFVEPNTSLSASSKLSDYTELLPNDNMFSLQTYATLLRLPEAWAITTGSPDIVIAMLDTGVVFSHPDLGGRLLPGYDFVTSASRSGDGDGIDPDPTDPGSANGTNNIYAWHGTHTTGIVAGIPDNAIGICGTTWHCSILPVRVLGATRTGNVYDLAEGIRYAAGLPNASGTLPIRKANVINMSLDSGAGSTAPSSVGEACREAWQAGCVLVAASGNQQSSEPSYPAAFSNVISVGALSWNLNRASFSNYGSTLDICAPTGDSEDQQSSEPPGVLSTVAASLDTGLALEYAYREGTSMASPQVAGVAALMLSINPNLSTDQVRDILQDTAVDLGVTGRDDDYGYGMVDAYEAVARATVTQGTSVALSRPYTQVGVLDFAQDTTQLSFLIEGIDGAIPASLPGITVSMGADWLSADMAPTAMNDTTAIVFASADRSQLSTGQHHGIIEITIPNEATRQIDVYITADQSYASPDEIIVVAIHPETRSPVSRSGSGTTLVNTTTYTMTGLPDDGCLLIAGTDRDGDGVICEQDDACGAWPNLGNPEVALESEMVQNTPSIIVYEQAPGREWPFSPISVPGTIDTVEDTE